METHDAGRVYPFPCPVKDCSKKFVRKTDLARHHQSVHMKQRNHQCDYCSRFFARKDTLRRHMEDGCSKRFDLGTVDFTPQEYSGAKHHESKDVSRTMSLPTRQSPDSIHAAQRHPSASHMGQVSYNHPLSSISAGFIGSGNSQGPVWAN